jgi:hypothetical protein
MHRYFFKLFFTLLGSLFLILGPLLWADEKSDEVDRLFAQWDREGSPEGLLLSLCRKEP